jgi:hypothetical protein
MSNLRTKRRDNYTGRGVIEAHGAWDAEERGGTDVLYQLLVNS